MWGYLEDEQHTRPGPGMSRPRSRILVGECNHCAYAVEGDFIQGAVGVSGCYLASPGRGSGAVRPSSLFVGMQGSRRRASLSDRREAMNCYKCNTGGF